MPRLFRLDPRVPGAVAPGPAVQLASVAAIAAIGVAALALTPRGTAPTAAARPAAAAVAPSAQRPTAVAADRLPAADSRPAARRAPAAPAAPVRPPTARPAPAAPAKPVRHVAPPRPWMPTGTGMWLYQWQHSEHGQAVRVVRRADAAGLSTLFVRTGSSHDGYTGGPVLHQLLPATRGTSLRVVAWDFPELDHPTRDAQRLAAAARVQVAGVHVAAVAPDVETRAEGTHSSPDRVRRYLVALRRSLPAGVSILTTVPWPSVFRVGRYPYATVAAHSDALLPMAYWYDNSPTHVTAASMRFLRRYGRPVMPVGQGYDGKLDVPSLPHNNLRKQVPAFFATAHKLGARAVSLWSWQAAPHSAWSALSRARHWFPRQR